MLDSYKEKRSSPRINTDIPINYYIRGAAKSEHTVCNDISQGGISFTTNSFIAPDTVVMLELILPNRMINSIAKIVWASPISHSDRKKVGLEFIELEYDQKRHLLEYLNIQLNK